MRPALRVSLNHCLGADEPSHESKMCPVTDRVRRDRELAAANTALIIFSHLDPTNACRATTWALHPLRPAHLPHPADASGFCFEARLYAAYWERHGKPRPVATERIQFKQFRHGYPTLSIVAGMTLPARSCHSRKKCRMSAPVAFFLRWTCAWMDPRASSTDPHNAPEHIYVVPENRDFYSVPLSDDLLLADTFRLRTLRAPLTPVPSVAPYLPQARGRRLPLPFASARAIV